MANKKRKKRKGGALFPILALAVGVYLLYNRSADVVEEDADIEPVRIPSRAESMPQVAKLPYI